MDSGFRGNDSNGRPLTTSSFISYLTKKKPQFYDATHSGYCWSAATGSLFVDLCNILPFEASISDIFRVQPGQEAATVTPWTSLVTWFRPSFILLNTSGRNMGNEATIFHEAIHGITGRFDADLQNALGSGSCGITQYLQSNVLIYSPGLDRTTSCP